MFSFFRKKPTFDKEVDAYITVDSVLFKREIEKNLATRIASSSDDASVCIESIMKRMSNDDPRQSMKALELLDNLVRVAGRMFRIQIEMEPFEKEFRQVIFKTNLITSLSMYALLKQWSEEFSLFRLREICERLRSEGFISDSELIQCACASVTSQNLIPINIREALRSLASYSTASASNESHSYSPRQPLPITIGASAPFLPLSSNTGQSKQTATVSTPNPSATISKPKQELIVDCSICMEFKENAEIVATECGHLYHKHCIYQWLQQSNTCPDCRLRTTQSSLRKLFVPLVARDVDQPNSSEIENLAKTTKKMNLASKPNPQKSTASTSRAIPRSSNNSISGAAGNNRGRPRRNRVNTQTSSATNFNRMIWLGANNKNMTKEAFSTLILEKFDITRNKFVIENLFLERNRAQMRSVSFKISVDNEDTFNRLMNSSTWRPYRVREFKDRSRNTTVRTGVISATGELIYDD